MEDHHVDRPDVEARQRAQLTGTNRSFDLIVLITEERIGDRESVIGKRMFFDPDLALHLDQFCFTVIGYRRSEGLSLPITDIRRPITESVLCRPGGSCEAIRPDPIPNSAVKRLSANGTLSQDTGE